MEGGNHAMDQGVRVDPSACRAAEVAEPLVRTSPSVVAAGGPVAQAMIAFRTFLGENDLLASLAHMAPSLVELRRVLQPTSSLDRCRRFRAKAY